MNRKASPARGFAVAAATLLVAAGAAWLVGPRTPDRDRAILFAATVCLAGSTGAAIVAGVPPATAATRAALPLLGMALRLGPALAALAWLQTNGAQVRAAGAASLLAAFYLAVLAADLVRIITWGRDSGCTPRDSGPN